MKKFMITISGLSQEKTMKVFEVPMAVLKDPAHKDEIQAAGWFYMNYIDFFSCTGPYEWCVLPLCQVLNAIDIYNKTQLASVAQVSRFCENL